MPAAVSIVKLMTQLVRLVLMARSSRPAPMFWPTSVEVANERPIAGMMAQLSTRCPMP